MTLQQFQATGYLLTEKEVAELEKLILLQYKTALERINERIAVMYAQAGDVKPADMYNWAIQYNRLQSLQSDIFDLYKKYDKSALSLQTEASSTAFQNNFYRQQFALEWQEPIKFTTLDPAIVNYSITGQQEVWKKITNKLGQASDWNPAAGTLSAILKKNQATALTKIMTEINSGLISGDSYVKISKRIAGVIGEVYNGKVNGELAKAMRIARTEGHRAQNMGEMANSYYAEEQGLVILRMWDATLDNRVRPEHGSADGQKVATDKPFYVGGEELQFPGDPSGRADNTINCRCHAITLAGKYEPTARRGINPVTGRKEVFSYTTFDDWVEKNGLTRNKYGRIYAKQ